MIKIKLTIILWLLARTQSVLIWLQNRRFSIVEAELTKLEKGG